MLPGQQGSVLENGRLVLPSALPNSSIHSDSSRLRHAQRLPMVEGQTMQPLRIYWGSPFQTDLEIPSGVLGAIAIRSASKCPALEWHVQLRSSSVDPLCRENVNHRQTLQGCIFCACTVVAHSGENRRAVAIPRMHVVVNGRSDPGRSWAGWEEPYVDVERSPWR
jgi:hypothetical protein